MVKETEKFDRKGEFSPHDLPISGGSPKGATGGSLHWKVGINPQQVSATSCVKLLWNHRAGLHMCFVEGMSFTHISTP